MDFQNWMDLIIAILTVFIGVITFGAHRLFTAKTKNANLNSFNEWANQAVNYVEKKFTDNDTKKKEAISYLTRVLKKNKLLDKFTDEEIDAAIEFAVGLLPHSIKDMSALAPLASIPSSIDVPDDKTLVINAPKVTVNDSTAVPDPQLDPAPVVQSESQADSAPALTNESTGPYIAK